MDENNTTNNPLPSDNQSPNNDDYQQCNDYEPHRDSESYDDKVYRLKTDSATRSSFFLFRILLVFSIICSGTNCLSNLSMGLMLPAFQQQYPMLEQTMQSNTQMAEMFEMMKAHYEQVIFDTPRAYYIIAFVLYAISLAGVIMMWRLRKNGFHYYAVAQLLIIIVTILYLGKAYMNIGNLMFTILFLVLYLSLLRSLGIYSPKQEGNHQ